MPQFVAQHYKSMRIGIEAQRLFRARKHGMDIVALELIRHLQQLDTQHEYIVFVRPGPDRCLEASENVTICELRAPTYPLWEQVALPLAAARMNVDVLHCTANTAPLWCPVPVILTLHDVIFLEQRHRMKTGGTWYQRFGNAYRAALVPHVARRAAHVLTVSHFEKGRIQEVLDLPVEQLSVAYNGVSKRFHYVADAQQHATVRARYNLPERFVLFFGNTDPKKNLPGVLTAYLSYAQQTDAPIPLVLADYDEARLLAWLDAHQCRHLRPLFILPGYLQHDDLPTIYSLCTLFLYPSLRESFGLPILEAMGCGAPVVTSSCASMPEVSGFGALHVDPTAPQELTDLLCTYLADPDHSLAPFRRQGPQRAAQFSWHRTAARVRACYERYARNLQEGTPFVEQPARFTDLQTV